MATPTAREKNKAQVKYHVRSMATRDFWRKQGKRFALPHYEFRIWAVRGSQRWMLSGITITNGQVLSKGFVTGFSWDDSRPILTGSLSAREPGLSGTDLKLQVGDLIVCEVGTGPKPVYRELWRMRCWNPGLQLASGEWTYDLASDLQRLAESYDDFKFVKDKQHPNGWTGDQIIAFVCKLYGIKASIPKMKHRFVKLVWVGDPTEDRSVYSLLVHVLKVERNQHHRRFRMDMVGRELRITPFVRNKELFELGDTILDGTLQSTKHERFATSVRVSNLKTDEVGVDTKKNRKVKHRKIVVLVTSALGVRRFGLVRRRVYSPDATTPQRAREEGQAYIAETMQATKELTISHPGIPTLKRANAIRALLPDAGVRRVVYVMEARHSVTSNYTMELVLSWDDIFVEQSGLNIADVLTDVAHERARTATATKKKKKKQPAKAVNRATAPSGVPPYLGTTGTPVKGK